MTTALIVLLFAAVAVATVLTLADSVLRARAAWSGLRADVKRASDIREVTMMWAGIEGEARMPALRSVSAARASARRTAPSGSRPPLRAAA